MSIKVLVSGAQGRMGQVTVNAVQQAPGLELVGQAEHDSDLNQLIIDLQPQVVVDFSTPSAVFQNCQMIIDHNVCPVIGTTGLTAEQIKTLQEKCQTKNLGGIIAPNFSLGAILMMRYAADAAKHFSDAEIIEYHHDQKVDSPSGTAIKTAELMQATNPSTKQKEDHPARGTHDYNTPIHSVRLPGLFAHQTVMFGGTGESLTIRHDAFSREAMMPGVILSVRKVIEIKDLIYGLEHIL